MTEKEFINCMNYLKGLYVNWKFETNDGLMVRSWYRKLGRFDSNALLYMIDKYSDSNSFPPQSPADLIQILCDDADFLALQPEQAWAKVVNLIRRYGFFYHRDEIYRELEKENVPALTATVRDMESALTNLVESDTYTPERFKKIFASRMSAETAEQKLARIGYNTNPQLSGNQKQIGGC